MKGLPRIAVDLLQLFGIDPSLIGDLDESAQAGRSRSWCWYQGAGVLLLSSWRLGVSRPWYALRGIVIGWTALLSTFTAVMLLAGAIALRWSRPSQCLPT